VKTNKCEFTPAHQLLVSRNHEFWQSYWDADFISFPHYVGALSAKIRTTKAKRVFVISEDRAYFLGGILAAMYAKADVVLPQSDSPEFLKDLMLSTDVLLTDNPKLVNAAPGYTSMHLDYDSTIPIEFFPLDPETTTIIFYTSGSTGKPKAVKKRLRQLDAEVEVLHALWGQGPHGRFLSTVSHHHLYAFLYSLLWPVCAGFSLERRTFTYWGDLLAKSKAGDFLISSPTHLGRFSVWKDCHPETFQYAFSSGSPLSYEAAIVSKKYLGTLPIEVYGSTETGGIAYRQQEQPSTPWQRFDCVELSSNTDSKLVVKSPYIEEAYQTEDLIAWTDADFFHLLGRADRVVKVEGKRVSLAEIEYKLGESDLVAEAAVLPLDKSYRDELGAVIVLTELGTEQLHTVGKAALTRQFREVLSLYFHPVLIPRKWRFVGTIPLNSQGKRQQSILKGYFESAPKSILGPLRQPIILDKVISQSRAEYSLKIPTSLAYLEGHFKNMPIVPGIVQLHWAIEFAKSDLDVIGKVGHGNQIKFARLMKPDDEVELCLEYNLEKSCLSYRYQNGEQIYSSGRIKFRGDE